MMKRVLALALCLVSVLLCFAGCAKSDDDKGAYIRAYLTEPIYDFDPLNAFDNADALQIVSMLFEGLFYADENGKPQKGLVDSYKYKEDKDAGTYKLTLTLKETRWTDGVVLTANDAQYSFRRLFQSENSHRAAALLFDVKNARAISEGTDSIDHLGVTVVDQSTLEIEFEKSVDIDTFLVNLCSPALYPLRADIVDMNKDWAKKPSTLVTSGPFRVRAISYTEDGGFILERNSYYFRDRSKDDIDKSVQPFRIVMVYNQDFAEMLTTLGTNEPNALRYIGRLPISLRRDINFTDIHEDIEMIDAPSTHVYYLNQAAEINGQKLFADPAVRQALSLVIDRELIAKILVYAEAADGLVPHTVLDRADKKTEFREKAESYIAASANKAEAEALLKSAGITASDFSFAITVDGEDEDHILMAELVASAWCSLGFHVSINKLQKYEILEPNPDNPNLPTKTGMYASSYREALEAKNYEVIGLDLVATSPTAFGYLAPFAKAFSGNALNMDATVNPNYELTPHDTGYDSEAYNQKIEDAYAAANEKTRAALLHEAETILMEDMPVIPVVYNKTISLEGKKLSGIGRNFFCNFVFTDAKLSGYWKIALADGFVSDGDEYYEE